MDEEKTETEENVSHETTEEIIENETNDKVVEDVSHETIDKNIFDSLSNIIEKLDILSKEVKDYSQQRNAIAVEAGEVVNEPSSGESVVLDKIEDIPAVDDLDLSMDRKD